MKFNMTLLDTPLVIEKPTFFVIEDSRLFANVAQELHGYDVTSKLKIYDSKFKNISKNQLIVISDLLTFSFQSTTVLKSIYSDLSDQLNLKPHLKSEIESLISHLYTILLDETLDYELNLDISMPEIQDIFKFYGIRIAQNSENVLEKTLKIIRFFKCFLNKKLLVFINVCSFFSEEEIEEIIAYSSMLDATILFLEQKKIYDVKQFILDTDFYLNEISEY